MLRAFQSSSNYEFYSIGLTRHAFRQSFGMRNSSYILRGNSSKRLILLSIWIYGCDRPNNLSLVCLYLSLYISFLLFGHFFLKRVWQKKKVQIIKKEIYNDKRQIIRSTVVTVWLQNLK